MPSWPHSRTTDGQTVDFNDKFVDSRSGTELEHPHDPQAKAVDVIRCRCTFVVVNKRDANGRLIRKNTGMILPISRTLNIPPPPPPQELRPVFVPAKTKEEAFEFSKKLGIKTDTRDLPLRSLNEINGELFDLLNQYKAPKLNRLTTDATNGYAAAKRYEIRFNKKEFSDLDKLQNKINSDSESGWLHKNASVKSLVSHEFAHVLTEVDLLTNTSIRNQINKIKKDYEKAMINQNDIKNKDFISLYANEKIEEFVAESFAHIRSGGSSIYAQSIFEIIQKNYKK